jgi:hypothetical protein
MRDGGQVKSNEKEKKERKKAFCLPTSLSFPARRKSDKETSLQIEGRNNN